jgi:NAD(P)-dependent dehydrogenase (short-subunit alcohol dehydrogenase family)
MLLRDKVAVIYGAGDAVGGTVARAFAAEGGARRGRIYAAP